MWLSIEPFTTLCNRDILQSSMQTNSLRLAGSSAPAKDGVFFIGSKKIFWKVVDELTLAREIRGYESVAQYYPVPKLCGHLYLGDGQYADEDEQKYGVVGVRIEKID